MNVPDPEWKLNPDIVGDESFRAAYEMGDDCDEYDGEFMIHDPFGFGCDDYVRKYEAFAVYDPE